MPRRWKGKRFLHIRSWGPEVWLKQPHEMMPTLTVECREDAEGLWWQHTWTMCDLETLCLHPVTAGSSISKLRDRPNGVGRMDVRPLEFKDRATRGAVVGRGVFSHGTREQRDMVLVHMSSYVVRKRKGPQRGTRRGPRADREAGALYRKLWSL
jgi:hypothetical protein